MRIIKRCPICGNLISGNQVICSYCNNKIAKEALDNYMVRCPVCSYPMFSQDYECQWCNKENGFNCYSLFDYKNTWLRDILIRFKINGDLEMSSVFAMIFANIFNNINIDKNNTVIVPVPCSASSRNSRGWDHMQEVCKKLNKIYGYSVKELLLNTDMNSTQQKYLDKEDRITKAKNKFKFNKKTVNPDKEKTLIIIDDIVTTGSTIKSCYKTLKNEGFENIRAVTVFTEL